LTRFEDLNSPVPAHTLARAWQKLEKQRGNLGMTWKLKVRGLVFGLGVLGALAMASGASFGIGIFRWIDWLF
jgi:hypothetical protein